MSDSDLKLIDEFLNFKDFSQSKKGEKNQEIGPWGTPLGNQDIFCYRKRLEETSALTNKSAKKQLKQVPPQFIDEILLQKDYSTQFINLQMDETNNTTLSNTSLKKSKLLQNIQNQSSYNQKKSDSFHDQDFDISAETSASNSQKNNRVKIKHFSVGRVIADTDFQIPCHGSISIVYEKDIDKLKKALKDQNENQKMVNIQNNIKDFYSKLMDSNSCSSLALIPESCQKNSNQSFMIHSNQQKIYNSNSRIKRNIRSQSRKNSNDQKSTNKSEYLDNNMNKQNYLLIKNQQYSPNKKVTKNLNSLKEERIKKHFLQPNEFIDNNDSFLKDPKRRINQIREELNMFEEGKKKFEKVLKISRLQSMTPEQEEIHDISTRKNSQKVSNANKFINERKKSPIKEVPSSDKFPLMYNSNKIRLDQDVSDYSLLDYRIYSQNQQRKSPISIKKAIQIQESFSDNLKDHQNQQEHNKLPQLQNNSNLRGIKYKFQQPQKSDNLEFYKMNISPISKSNKADFSNLLSAKPFYVKRNSDNY